MDSHNPSRQAMPSVIPHMPSPIHAVQQMSIAAMLTLLIGIIPFVMAAGYAIWPSESKLALMRPLSLAGIFSGLTGFAIGCINLLMGTVLADPDRRFSMGFVGLAESMVPLA